METSRAPVLIDNYKNTARKGNCTYMDIYVHVRIYMYLDITRSLFLPSRDPKAN